MPTSPAMRASTPTAGASDAVSAPNALPEPATDREERRERSSRRPAPEIDRPRHELEYDQYEQRAPGDRPAQCSGDIVVAHTERARFHKSDQADHHRADRGPPHPVNADAMTEPLELILDGVAGASDRCRDRTNDAP